MAKPVWVGLEKDLHEFAYGEGGGYINDYLSRWAFRWTYTQTPIPQRVALDILRPMGIMLDNKEFVKISKSEDVKGNDDRPMHTFLYRHDFTWYLYNLEA